MAVVTAVVGLAKALKMTITAEGVETDTQLDVLIGLGVDDAQGYLLARPAPAADFAGVVDGWVSGRAAASVE